MGKVQNVPCLCVFPLVAPPTVYSSNQLRGCDDDTPVKHFIDVGPSETVALKVIFSLAHLSGRSLVLFVGMHLNKLCVLTQPPITLSEADYPQEEHIVRTSLTDTYNIGAMTCITWQRPALQLRFLVTGRVWNECKGDARGGSGLELLPSQEHYSPRLSQGSTVQLAHRRCSCSSSWPVTGLVGLTPESITVRGYQWHLKRIRDYAPFICYSGSL